VVLEQSVRLVRAELVLVRDDVGLAGDACQLGDERSKVHRLALTPVGASLLRWPDRAPGAPFLVHGVMIAD
jgi:hypothetical protein